MQDSFTLAQEFVLLASDSETHRWKRPMRSYLETYVAGAVLIELLSEEVIRIGDKGKLEVIQHQYNGDEAARIMLHKLGQSRTKTMKKWIQSLYSKGKDRSQVFQAVVKPLVRNEDLKEEQYRIMLLFPASRYVPSAVTKDRIIQRIRAELLENGPVTQQTALLTMMLEMSKLLKGYFSEYERNELKKRLQRLQEEQGDRWKSIRIIRKAIEEMNAVMVSATAAAAT
jgi:hypothetical protein